MPLEPTLLDVSFGMHATVIRVFLTVRAKQRQRCQYHGFFRFRQFDPFAVSLGLGVVPGVRVAGPELLELLWVILACSLRLALVRNRRFGQRNLFIFL